MFEYLRELGQTKRARTALIAGFAIALLSSSLALADEHEPADEETIEVESTDPAPVEDRPDDGVIVFSLPDPDTGEFADCSGVEVGGDGEEAGEGQSLEGAVEGEEPSIAGSEEPEELTELIPDENGCYVVPALGPNGQWNHGQAVRAYVHAIKQLEYDGPRGHLVRNAAKSPIGKGAYGEYGDDGGDGEGLEPTSTSTSGKGKGKQKKSKP